MIDRQMAAPVLRLSKNEIGRDFVVGDIHGAYDLVLDAMRPASFDPSRDRLFAVGDLIDRGPGSHRCARFLAQPYVHAVRGNHEAALLDLYEDGNPPDDVLPALCKLCNGLGWWLDVPKPARREILAALRNLPFAIEIETRRGTVGLIHADVPAGMDWGTFLDRLESGEKTAIQTCLWGRSRAHRQDMSGVPGIGRVFVGHTPQWNGISRLGNVYAIDTGAVFGLLGAHNDGRMTLANMLMRTESLTAPPAHASGLVDLRDDGITPQTPFGAYLGR